MMRHLITGAGSGIGDALARALHDRGDELWLLARSTERAADLEASFPGARTVVADLADAEGLARLADSGDLPDRIDSLVHSAGVVELGTVADLGVAEMRAQLEVNLLAPMVLTRACLPALRAARGLVVLVNSGAGLAANPTWSAYAASKFGARGFADALRAEEGEHGVRVTSVYPSRTATPMQEKVHAQEGKDYDAAQWIQPGTVAATILHAIDLPADGTVSDLTVRPAPR
ncbi:SDR family oxidoreductase [Nocardioides donggukensis]|uniref:SDR family oxidoreductase n=1 Tax=Nocardioides donggukensis TaxID=2774019 RepID=A0A927K4K9_9ACTN|nr:SDR family oxidoreductase [Nocardioides donggukensis]MBD8870124.1 SDR family oxidoreductase [Nocardioides donggukensis]